MEVDFGHDPALGCVRRTLDSTRRLRVLDIALLH
jgi:hypothetical protein